ncbi:MAG: hypothetical protein JWP97_6709 [Labilithrix sp.]|nr:hypothetical protein [Labilithrix sp.]
MMRPPALLAAAALALALLVSAAAARAAVPGPAAPVDLVGSTDAGRPTDTEAAPSPAAPAHSDRGTRWVYAAAILGLVAGGLVAYFQKKKGSAAG